MDLRAYLTLFRARLRASLQYRFAALARIAPPLFVGFVQAQFFTAFYGGGAPGSQPMTLAQTITYCWLGQLLVHIQPWSGDPEAMQTIRTGNIAYELTRPLDLYAHWFSRVAAQRVVPLALVSLPLAAVALILMPDGYRMEPPASLASALTFLLTLAGTVLMSAALSNLMSIITVWTISGEGLYYLAPVIFQLFSGAIVPLPLFPDRFQDLLRTLPFSSLMDLPARTYLGLAAPAEAVGLLFAQSVWTIAFILLGRLLLKNALKAAVVQGG